jgi:O-antigen/teichoic acid export membrane protein
VIITGQAVQRARNEPGRFVLVVAVNVVGGQIAGVLLASIVSATAVVYLSGVAAASVIGAVLSLFWSRPSLAGLRDRVAVRRWFAIALPTIPHMAALYLMTAGDRYIVLAVDNEEAAAAYNVAYLVGALGITLVAAANNAWAPLIYAAPDETRWQILATTTADMLRIAAIAAGGLAMGAPLGLWIAADPDKYDIAALTPLAALTTVPYVLYLASVHVLFQTGRTIALMWISPLAVGLALAAKALVLPRFGFVGLAVVTVAAYGLLALLVGVERRKLATVPWRRRWPELGAAAVLCVAGALIPLNWAGAAARAVILLGLIGLLLRVAKQLAADRRAAQAQARAAAVPGQKP